MGWLLNKTSEGVLPFKMGVGALFIKYAAANPRTPKVDLLRNEMPLPHLIYDDISFQLYYFVEVYQASSFNVLYHYHYKTFSWDRKRTLFHCGFL